jgi:tetratricopeptide (TPR) repeat protein
MHTKEILYAITFIKKGISFSAGKYDEGYKFDTEKQQFEKYCAGFDRSEGQEYYSLLWCGGEADFEEMLKLKKDDMFYDDLGRCFYNQGIVRFYQGDYTSAEEDFTKARHYYESCKSHFIYNVDFADSLIQHKKGNLAAAGISIRKATDAFSPLVWHALSTVFGYKYDDREHLQLIVNCCRDLLQADPENWELYYEIAGNALKLGNIEEAETALDSADRYFNKSESYKAQLIPPLREKIRERK